MRVRPQRVQVADSRPIPAAMGGLNARDSLAAMPPQDASVFTNLFAETTRVRTRAGHSTFSTASSIGIANQYEGFNTLMSYQGEQLFGVFGYFNNSGGAKGKARIYSVNTTTGALTLSAEVEVIAANSLLALGEWANFTSGAGTRYLLLMAVDDAVGQIIRAYNGSAWSDLASGITGLPVGGLLGVHPHQGRLWFYGDGTSLSAYYLPRGAIGGTAVQFNLGPFATKGGTLQAMRTWTVDNGEGGSDDLAVFVTSNGQAIVYAGTDPSSASTWQLVGVFDVSEVASEIVSTAVSISLFASGTNKDAFALKYGADCLLLLKDGVTSTGRITKPQLDGNDYSLSAKIRPLISESLRAQSIYFPKLVAFEKLNQLFVNIVTTVTQSGGGAAVINQTYTSIQYVMNTETGAWSKFEGMNMKDAVVHDGVLYFTDGTYTIKKYDGTATSDAGSAITFEVRQAYNYLDYPMNKLATLMQPMMRWTGNFSLNVQADADFNPGSISTYTSYTVGAESNVNPLISPAKYGVAFATHMKGQTSAGVGSWYATRWTAQPGGIIG